MVFEATGAGTHRYGPAGQAIETPPGIFREPPKPVSPTSAAVSYLRRFVVIAECRRRQFTTTIPRSAPSSRSGSRPLPGRAAGTPRCSCQIPDAGHRLGPFRVKDCPHASGGGRARRRRGTGRRPGAGHVREPGDRVHDRPDRAREGGRGGGWGRGTDHRGRAAARRADRRVPPPARPVVQPPQVRPAVRGGLLRHGAARHRRGHPEIPGLRPDQGHRPGHGRTHGRALRRGHHARHRRRAGPAASRSTGWAPSGPR